MTTGPVISCTNISKSFEQRLIPTSMLQDRLLKWRLHRKKWSIKAVDNVSLSVRRGEWVGLYGPNGSGKTTLLRIIAGLLRQDSGQVRTQGLLSCFFGLGVGFHPERTAAENIYIHGLLHGLAPAEIRRLTEGIIEFAGLESHRDLPVKCYSTGMQLRLAFAAAAHVESDIYLLDEVLAVGDAEFQGKCMGHLREMRKKGKTVVMVGHGLQQLEGMCGRVLFLADGRLMSEGVTPFRQNHRG